MISTQPAQRGSRSPPRFRRRPCWWGRCSWWSGCSGSSPGVTTDYDTLTFAGHHTEAALLGIFQVSVLHNIVHLLFGVAGIAAARTAGAAKGFLVGGGLIYLVLWIYGLVIDQDGSAYFVPVNTADNWLHLVLGAGMVVLGLLLPRLRTTAPRLIPPPLPGRGAVALRLSVAGPGGAGVESGGLLGLVVGA
ncbi:hypothetical membrane protein [Rhodococcus opacus B4]|uniref:Hypothetical membrane protein n=1 Tax=Rhodococcus opacus (strain B4) TaxID=632772 RepID=C1ASF6_RHOOB|nr:hypothetical membrane protein [Rhodococcus opacus B4]